MTREEMVHDLALGAEDFKAKFNGSPLLRAKRKGTLRNLATVLTNEREVTAVAALNRLMEREEDADLRETLRWALDTLRE